MLCSRLLGVMVILLGRTARLAGYGENRCLFRLPAERPQKEQIPTGGNMSASQPNSEDDERFKKFYLFFVEFVYLRPPESLRFCSALLSPAAKSIPANHLRPLFEYSYGSGEKPNPKLLTMYFSYVNDWDRSALEKHLLDSFEAALQAVRVEESSQEQRPVKIDDLVVSPEDISETREQAPLLPPRIVEILRSKFRVTVVDAQRFTGESRTTIYKRINDGILKTVGTKGKGRKILAKSLLKYMGEGD